MAITSSSTHKLLLLVLGFVCALHVSSSASLSEPGKPQPRRDDDDDLISYNDDAKIDIRKFATKDGKMPELNELQLTELESTLSDEEIAKMLEFQKLATEDQEMLSIKRVDNGAEQGKRVDQVDSRNRPQCVFIRMLSIPEYTFGRKRGWTEISQESAIDDDRKKWQIKLNVIPESDGVPSEDLSQMYKDVHESKSVLREYMNSLFDDEMEKPILDFFDGNESLQLLKLISFLAKDIFEYDIAIDYITSQYKEHCLNTDGIVQKNKLHYLKLWWISVKGRDQDDLTWLEAFMATACLFPDAISDPETLEPIPKEELLAHLGKSEDLEVDFSQDVTKVEEVKALWPYLPMIKDSTKNSDLIQKLVESFELYKKMDESHKKAHDEDFWLGYQKKLIVLQTIIKVKPEELKKKSSSNDLLKVPENDLISDPINGSIKDPINVPINPQNGGTKRWYDNAVFNLAKRHPYWAFGGTVAVLTVGGMAYYIFGPEDPTVTSESFTNATTSSPKSAVDDGAWIAWLIVGVTIIVAILILSFVCYLIRRKKSRKRNRDDDDSEDKTSSKTTTGNTSTSTGPSSSPGPSRPKSTTASLVTSPVSSPMRSPTLIRSRISSPGPVKSALGKPPSISSPTSSIHASNTSSYFGASSAHSSAASSFSALGGNSSAFSSTGGGGSTLSAASSCGGGSVGSVFVGSSFAGSNVAGSSAAPSSATSHVDSTAASEVTSLSSVFSGAGSRAPKVAKSKAASPKAAPPKAPPAKTLKAKAPIPPKVQPGAKSPFGKSPQSPKVSPPPVKQSPTKVSKATTPPGKAPPTSPSKGTTITKPEGSGDPKGVQKKKK